MTSRNQLYLIVCLAALMPSISSAQQKNMLLWFDWPAYQPAVFSYNAPEFQRTFHFEKRGWVEALPVGNGRMGAMVFGGVLRERIQLNEETIWDGYRRNSDNPAAVTTCLRCNG